jgi:RNA polymerase sigma-70 factor, ECF subfamily
VFTTSPTLLHDFLITAGGSRYYASVTADPTPRPSTPELPRGAALPVPVHTLRSLFEAHYSSIWRLLRRLGVAPAQLDDAAQEVFWVAARKWTCIQPGSEHAFLYGVALRVASNERKRAHAHLAVHSSSQAPEQACPNPTPEEALIGLQARELLDAVLARMSDVSRTVFVLRELEGLEIKVIAELEAIPLGTASSRLRHAREEFSEIAARLQASLRKAGGS